MRSVRGRFALLAGVLGALGVAVLGLGSVLYGVDAQGGATVAIVDFAFDPALTSVVVGDTITWTNLGAEPHTVTADDSTFTSGLLQPGETFSQTFATTGSDTYRCRIHPSMTGTVVVNGGAVGGEAAGAEMEAVPVVGVGTMAPRPSDAMAWLAGVVAIALGAVAFALRRA